eukprot:CAMPEP_0185576918 /NCGR_PEP_ID=MMETSP0434-20130131/7735_1 /TAXON_ID=626734 ORGANISM="Favella taraikaensis, Strain Fe Narragansett Bay" /NCGR_SAMPLE_ID=MMETSP0434 /ASSEMBLY_ACC=CAM_ASM_000379 /LENGTH=257 /DNA_ID=CAMNT_0028194309 /DNA_START=292 /DNA_END=1065 /DNA_ORIENTATION=+
MACDRKACRFDALSELGCVRAQLVEQLRRLFEHVKHFDGGSCHRRCNGVREKVGTTLIPQYVHHFLIGGRVPAGSTSQRLAERRADHIDLALEAKEFRCAATSLTKDTRCVALVNESESSVSLGKFVDLVKGRDVTVHGKDAVSNDDSQAAVLRLLQHLLQHLHVHVLVAQASRLAKSDSVDDARVVELVRNNRIVWRQARFEEARIRVEPTRVEDGIVEFVEFCNSPLKLFVDVLCSADEAHGGHAIAMCLESVGC